MTRPFRERDGGGYNALILAAGRGENDPIARAFGISHKSLLPVAGRPMLLRVVDALESCARIRHVVVSIDRPELARRLLDEAGFDDVEIVKSSASAPASVLHAVRADHAPLPLLITTADHALLNRAMLDAFLSATTASGADLTVGLAAAETILSAYPETKRTFLNFAGARYSGCNLFALNSVRALNAVAFWQSLDENRKSPWRLIGAFGILPLFSYAIGRLTRERAFEAASKALNGTIRPVDLPFAEAAIDVDKPSDKELVELILASRQSSDERAEGP